MNEVINDEEKYQDMESLQNEHGTVVLEESALNKKCFVYKLTSYANEISVLDFLDKFYSLLKETVENVKKNATIVAHIRLRVKMIDLNHADGSIYH